MKLLTQEEKDAHYRTVVRAGTGGGLVGLGVSCAASWLASKRYPIYRSLTLPFKAFLVTSAATFSAIIFADRASTGFERQRNPLSRFRESSSETLIQQVKSQKSRKDLAFEWMKEYKFSLVFGSWLASMGLAWGIMHRNPYLTSSQKIVQARLYAQALTIAALLTTFGLEAFDKTAKRGRWEVVSLPDPDDPTRQKRIDKLIHHERYAGEDKWLDMVQAAERKLKKDAELRQNMTPSVNIDDKPTKL